MAVENIENTSADNLVQIKDLKKWFPIYGGIISRVVAHVKAVNGVSFQIKKRETFGLVGESGCGKSTLGRLIMRLIEPTEGSIYIEGKNVLHYDKRQLRQLRRNVQIIFQDPYASLNPRMKAGQIIGLPLQIHRLCEGKELQQRVLELMEMVGLSSKYINRYPFEFSGGQRQRIGIARALSLNPKLVVCDEAVSALDVSIRSQILNLLEDLQEQLDLTYLFISHDLSVIRHLCDRIGVMYLGKMVEVAAKDSIYENPLHPYTKALLSAIPTIHPDPESEIIALKGEIPSPIDPPAGCNFHPRCWIAEDICRYQDPPRASIDEDHSVTCHRQKDL